METRLSEILSLEGSKLDLFEAYAIAATHLLLE